ncbi:CubicO group peptidase, beta-lactamase class C family [Friedmanniella luteola]|uniref:CubicO group peptidase, beta-lactamase class C family n=1 Tax=Friedmanniella luteola TaxID=546871 RepID=A0A1H1WAF7_9ACTN|nr:serine hydrolase domain-containing protein [Friedmanniella luteola]SDS93129.1 CubicO group peptidase, beta-lactamase class C family [Friedmanniella luteola]
MEPVPAEIARIVSETSFSGVVRADLGDGRCWSVAAGPASRRFGVLNRPDTPFGIASGTKGLTALTVMSLVEDGTLNLATTARSVLGADLPLVDDRVTVEHLLGHRSGIGDYLDESELSGVDDHVLRVPVHRLDSTEAYLAVLQGFPTAFPPDERFAYCNGGYVVLALIAERAAGVPFADLVQQRVCGPAGMTGSGFARGDAPPEGAAEGYLVVDGEWRTNVLHLPVLGSGDGGMYAPAADLAAFWSALFAGRVVAPASLAVMVQPRSDVPEEGRRYGLGFWLHRTSSVVMLEGCDAGISFRSEHDPVTGRTLTTIANTADGAWPVAAALAALYGLD